MRPPRAIEGTTSGAVDFQDMTAALLEDRDIALQLHKLLTEIDPAKWREDKAFSLKPRLTELQQVLQRRPQHQALAAKLEVELPTLDSSKGAWLAFKQRVQPAYFELARRLQAASIHVPSLRPTNYARNLFHVSSALTAMVAIEFLGSPPLLIVIAGAFALFGWSLELARRVEPRLNTLLMKVFIPFAHPHEAHRINSATWYATALISLALTQSTLLCVAAVTTLGVGDPVAAIIGRRFGRTKLMHGRSLEGTLAFVVSASAVTFAVFMVFHPTLGLGLSLAFALTAGFAGAVAELVSLRIDDNFSIPISVGAAIALVSTLVGVAV